MRIPFLILAAVLLFFTSCDKDTIVSEIESTNETTHLPQTRSSNSCFPSTVNSLTELATALNAYDDCTPSGVISLPLNCSEPVYEGALSGCQQSITCSDFPMSGKRVVTIYNALTSCQFISYHCGPGEIEKYDFIFIGYETQSSCGGDFIQLEEYSLQCCTL